MTQVLEAIFEKGAFRLTKPPALGLAEGQQVRTVVEA